MDAVHIDLSSQENAKAILKRELTKRGISYPYLANLLSEKGWSLSKASMDNKMSRGTFSADFFLDSLRVIGCKSVEFDGSNSTIDI